MKTVCCKSLQFDKIEICAKVFPRLDRFIHDAWALICARFGPRLRIEKSSASLLESIPIREASQSELSNTLESSFYRDAPNPVGVPHPAITLLHLKNVTITGKGAFVFSGAHTLLRLDDSVDTSRQDKVRRPIHSLARKFQGPVVTLGGRCTDNHYHFLFEHLPLFLLIRRHLGEELKLTIFVNPGQSHWQKEYLERLGEPPESIVESSRGTLECNEVWLFKNVLLHERAFPYEASLYRELANRLKKGIIPRKRDRKVFLSRNDASRRRLANEEIIYSSIREIYPDIELIALSRMSLAEQIAVFAETCLIVGPAGQGFRNMLFCENALCVELLPGFREPGNIYAVWTTATTHLAMIHGNRYLPLYAQEDYTFDESDWTFPLGLVRKVFDSIDENFEYGHVR